MSDDQKTNVFNPGEPPRNPRMEIKYTEDEQREIDEIDVILDAIFDNIDFDVADGIAVAMSEITDEMNSHMNSLALRKYAILERALYRVISNYNGDMQQFYKDIKNHIVELAKGYAAFPWELVPENRREKTLEKIIKQGIFVETRGYLDYIEKEDPPAYDDLIAFIDTTAAKYSEQAASRTKSPELEKIKALLPPRYISTIDKISRLTFDNKLTAELLPLAMEEKGRGELTTFASINFEELDGVQINLSQYDKMVYSIIITWYHHGYTKISNEMIYKVMTGNPAARLTDKIAREITASIDRIAAGKMTIDATDEATKGKYKDLNLKFYGQLLQLQGITAEINGVEVNCFELLTAPLLYEYAKGKKQIASCDIKVLQSPINYTPEIMAIKQILLDRLMILKNPNNNFHNGEILYQGIYDKLNIDTAGNPAALRKKKKMIREHIETILQDWKVNGHIKDYDAAIKKGREIYKLKIVI